MILELEGCEGDGRSHNYTTISKNKRSDNKKR